MTDLVQSVVLEIAARILEQPMCLDLTPVEIQILSRVGQGKDYNQIKSELHLKNRGDVANRIAAIVKRTGVNKHRLIVYGAFLSLSLGDQWPNHQKNH